ncbi:hypothetical protein CPB83DRAFT_912115 [Crepidotus variabilis]|uniref:CxC2-like cysteine cluster KDZ transposase-associated domain-containing protein n=1 Tax=Crepidotus variabilis TaxID=179855 RepID=A0A9P6JWR5_9AGAR|nr:hypothetical protein CPB83DRAFT_912115 [Crepidotus variabilis]
MDEGRRCHHCDQKGTEWKCCDCEHGTLSCRACLRAQHMRSPLHRIQRWTGSFFEAAALWEVGVKLYLGHDGEICPMAQDQLQYESADGNNTDDEEEAVFHDDDEEAADIEDFIGRNIPGAEQGFRRAPRNYEGAHKRVVVVHVNGIHDLPTVECRCTDGPSDLQYLRSQLFPATQIDVRTVFSFALLKDTRLLNLKAKVTIYALYRFLQRLTSPAFPRTVPNRERELQRVLRQWRNLVIYQEGGCAHTGLDPVKGSLYLFCSTCPQIGINLPEDWEDMEFPSEPPLPMFVTDGNMKADHIKSRSKHPDAALTHGEGFMTEPTAYKRFLTDAVERAPKYKIPADCREYNVTKHEGRRKANLDITGIALHACARHGCFAPSSGVDFQKGERQMNIDYSFSETLKTTNIDGLPTVLHIYDIMCQYKVNMPERFRDSPYLSTPQSLQRVLKAIGQFHVHAHKEGCLYRFSTSYIPGVGLVDGEILETLWAILNEVSRSTRTATIQHRAEILDDHMGDSNYKKIIFMAATIARKYKRAIKEEPIADNNLAVILDACTPDDVATWTAEIEKAEDRRLWPELDDTIPEADMDIMKNKFDKGLSLRDIELQLTREEVVRREDGEAGWISTGLKLEETQFNIKMLSKGADGTIESQLKLERRRLQFQRSLQNFSDDAVTLFPVALTHIGVAEALPENEKILLPSVVPFLDRPADGQQQRLLRKELELRTAFTRDILLQIKELITHLSFQFIEKVRKSHGTLEITRAWDGVKHLREHLLMSRDLYNHSRERLIALGYSTDGDAEFGELSARDIDISPAIYNPNARGITGKGLSWIWGRLSNDVHAGDDYLIEFYRLHFLRARAHLHRCREEIKTTKLEMESNTRYMMFKAQQWALLRERVVDAGHRAYAAAMVDTWNRLGSSSEKIATAAFAQNRQIWVAVE